MEGKFWIENVGDRRVVHLLDMDEKKVGELVLNMAYPPRWTYGRGPGMDALDAMRVINALPPEERAKAAAEFMRRGHFCEQMSDKARKTERKTGA